MPYLIPPSSELLDAFRAGERVDLIEPTCVRVSTRSAGTVTL